MNMNIESPASLTRRQTLRQVMSLLASTSALSAVATATKAQAQAHNAHATPGTKITPLMTRDLAGHAGSEVNMVLVEYAGGQSSPAHQHAGPVFVYVIEGAFEMQITDGPLTTVRKGETFYEPPGGVHLVSRNASATEPAKLIAFIIGAKGVPATGPVEKR